MWVSSCAIPKILLFSVDLVKNWYWDRHFGGEAFNQASRARKSYYFHLELGSLKQSWNNFETDFVGNFNFDHWIMNCALKLPCKKFRGLRSLVSFSRKSFQTLLKSFLLLFCLLSRHRNAGMKNGFVGLSASTNFPLAGLMQQKLRYLEIASVSTCLIRRKVVPSLPKKT